MLVHQKDEEDEETCNESKKGREEGRKKEQRYKGTASLTYNWS